MVELTEKHKLDGKRTVPMRHFIAMVIFIAMLPPVILLSITLYRTADADRIAAEERFVDNAQLVAGMVESAAGAHAAMIQSLAASLDETGLIPVAQHFDGVIVLNPSSQDGAPAPVTWHLSNLYDINPGYGARVKMTIPHPRGSGSIQLLADAGALTRNMDLSQGQNSSMLVAVVDGNGKLISRSNQDNVIGRPVPTWDALVAIGKDRGIFDAETLEGEMITFGFSKIEHTDGWVVVIGLPKAAFDARWQEPRALLIIGALLTIAAAVLLASWMASLIVGPITGLVNRAQAILSDDTKLDEAINPSSITEIVQLQTAQHLAHQTMIARARELDLSGQRYRAMAKVGSVGSWRRCVTGEMIELEGIEALTGLEFPDKSAWLSLIHPDDVDEILAVWEELRDKPSPLMMELRLQTQNENYIWIRLRGTAILDDAGQVVEWIGTIENIDERMKQHLRISHLAFHDSLTGLPNRSQFEERLRKEWDERSADRTSALLYIDLDRFKYANDQYGHATGDTVLQLVADRLQRLIRPSDLVARIGGDEFAVIMSDIRDPSVATLVGLRVVKSLSLPYDVGGHGVDLGASVGISYLTAETQDLATLSKQADDALYRAKTSGRNRCVTYREIAETPSTLAN